MLNPNPECKKECSFSGSGSMTTLMGYTPTWDKHGNMTSRDPNITTSEIRCSTCGKRWLSRTQYGETTYLEQG
jgi:hypothetical protein